MRFSKSILAQGFKSAQPSYKTLLELSEKVREFPEPDWEQMRRVLDREDAMGLMVLTVKQACAGWYKEIRE